MENNELNHAGIKGMKWGVRRYQNKDGSLTPEGRKRYADSDDDDDYVSARSKSIRYMSDAELNKALNRVRMEQQYKELTKVEKSAGRKWIEQTLSNIGSNIATKLGNAAATEAIGWALKKAGMKVNNEDLRTFLNDTNANFSTVGKDAKAAAVEAAKEAKKKKNKKKKKG